MRTIPSRLHRQPPSPRTCARSRRASRWKLLSFEGLLRLMNVEDGVPANLADRLSIQPDDRDGRRARGQENREGVAQARSHWNRRTAPIGCRHHDVLDSQKSKPLERTIPPNEGLNEIARGLRQHSVWGVILNQPTLLHDGDAVAHLDGF